MVILDSSVWIAYLNKNDSQYKKAEKIFSNLENQKIILPEYIILEVSSVLLIRVSKKAADNFLKITSNNKNIDIILTHKDFFSDFIELFLNYSKSNLSFVDISLLFFSKKYKIITFDKKLEKAIEEYD